MRPADFTTPHRTSNITPYQMITNPSDLPERGSSNGGVFHRGQIVWTQDSPAHTSVPSTTLGFVDGLGHVLVDPRFLKRVDPAGAALNEVNSPAVLKSALRFGSA